MAGRHHRNTRCTAVGIGQAADVGESDKTADQSAGTLCTQRSERCVALGAAAMSSQPNPPAWDGLCVICQVNIGGDARPPYCSDHLAEREERSKTGWTKTIWTGGGATRWHSGVAVQHGWTMRKTSPASVSGNRIGTWVLFTRMYQGRLPDWIAVDAHNRRGGPSGGVRGSRGTGPLRAGQTCFRSRDAAQPMGSAGTPQ